jgi:hypothetical protein
MDEVREERLAQARPPHKPWRGEEPERTQQRKLLDGLECLRGQLGVFFEEPKAVYKRQREYESE